MKKEEKLKIIKWYIKGHCESSEIQTLKENIDDLNKLENLVMNDRAYPHCSSCSTCWYDRKDYCEKCAMCENGSLYTFPYGYWEKFYERDMIKS